MKAIERIALGLLTTAWINMSHAQQMTASWCETHWFEESANVASEADPNFGKLVARWAQFAERCRATVVYEARMAIALAAANQPAKAREALRPVLGTTSPHKDLVEFADISVDYFSQLVFGKPTRADVERMEVRLRTFVAAHPTFYDAHGLLGGLQTLLGKHSDAIATLGLGLRSSMDKSGVYYNLVISNVAVGKFDDALAAADSAYDLRKSVTSDPPFMIAVAKANSGVGNLGAAEKTLRVIAAKKPEVRNDPAFVEAVEFLASRMRAGAK